MDSREQMDGPSHEEIAARAYEIFNREGGTHGRDSDHWFQAEQELRAQRSGNSQSLGNQRQGNSAGQSGGSSRAPSGGLGQPVTGEAAMDASRSLAADASGKKSKAANSGSKAAKAARN